MLFIAVWTFIPHAVGTLIGDVTTPLLARNAAIGQTFVMAARPGQTATRPRRIYPSFEQTGAGCVVISTCSPFVAGTLPWFLRVIDHPTRRRSRRTLGVSSLPTPLAV